MFAVFRHTFFYFFSAVMAPCISLQIKNTPKIVTILYVFPFSLNI